MYWSPFTKIALAASIIAALAGCVGSSPDSESPGSAWGADGHALAAFRASYSSNLGDIAIHAGPASQVLDRDGRMLDALPLRISGALMPPDVVVTYWLDGTARVIRVDTACNDGSTACGLGSLNWGPRHGLPPLGLWWPNHLEGTNLLVHPALNVTVPKASDLSTYIHNTVAGEAALGLTQGNATYGDNAIPDRFQLSDGTTLVLTEIESFNATSGLGQLVPATWSLPTPATRWSADEIVSPWQHSLAAFVDEIHVDIEEAGLADGCLQAALLREPSTSNLTRAGITLQYREVATIVHAKQGQAQGWDVTYEETATTQGFQKEPRSVSRSLDCAFGGRAHVDWPLGLASAYASVPPGNWLASYGHELADEALHMATHSPGRYVAYFAPNDGGAHVAHSVVLSGTDGLPISVSGPPSVQEHVLSQIMAGRYHS